MNIFNKLLEFFGFGDNVEKPDNFERLLEDLSSQRRQEEAKQTAFQAIQQGDDIFVDRTHPYESTLRADSLMVDTACTQHHTEILKQSFGDAQYVAVLLQSGLQSELTQAAPKEIESKIRSAIAQNQAEAKAILDGHQQALRDIEIFKGANGLGSAANYPEKDNSLYLILALGIAEAIFNAIFLRQGISFGISLLIAVSVAIINIGGNVWLGGRYRDKNHIKPEIAKAGAINRVYSICLILGINGLIALYRLWYASDTNEINAQFLLESTILFIVGIGMGVLAFNKGYALDDPYPGYGVYARRLKEWADKLTELKKIHSEFCTDLKRKADLILDSLDNKIISASEKFSLQLPEMAQELHVWESDRSKINFAYRQLQEIFKITIVGYHTKGHEGYPKELLDLPINPQLESYKTQVDRYLNRKEELVSKVGDLREEVKKQRNALHKWWQESTTVELLEFPK